VVFDRIRERLRARTREPLDRLVNDACLQTVPRTVNTGLGALFILAALFVLGGDTLTDFALALLVGIGVGTWSSMFVAAPLLVTFEQHAGHQPTRAHPPPARQPGRPKPAPATRPRPAAETTRATAGQPRARAPRPKQRKRPARRGNRRRR
jgi:SecD/SecF fusion protein